MEVNALVLHECNQGLTGFIVEALELRLETASNEDDMGAAVGELDLVVGAGVYGLDVDVIAIIAIHDQYVGHARCGNAGEVAGLICKDHAGC